MLASAFTLLTLFDFLLRRSFNFHSFHSCSIAARISTLAEPVSDLSHIPKVVTILFGSLNLPTMKTGAVLQALSFVALAHALPTRHVGLTPREVPQEHSHEQFLDSVRTSLTSNNPAGIVDPVFGLLGDAVCRPTLLCNYPADSDTLKAAAAGLGSISDVECLQQATADQAFTNAKAAGDVAGMTNALIYRALERNTGTVGGKSNLCTSITAVNSEIAAIQQHQDPASAGAAETNKQIALNLAVQISSIGGDPQAAIKSGTFAPGDLSDNTGKGNTCKRFQNTRDFAPKHKIGDTTDDPIGCIFSDNLLVPDVTADEINAAVSSGSAASAGTAGSASVATAASSVATPSPATVSNVTGCIASQPSASVASAPGVAASSNSTSPTPTATISAAEFGTCTGANPDITFGPGFDGRNEVSFLPVDGSDFNHGSALGIGVITSFICQQLKDKCKASETVLSACASGSAAAAAASGQAAADAFNAAFA